MNNTIQSVKDYIHSLRKNPKAEAICFGIYTGNQINEKEYGKIEDLYWLFHEECMAPDPDCLLRVNQIWRAMTEYAARHEMGFHTWVCYENSKQRTGKLSDRYIAYNYFQANVLEIRIGTEFYPGYRFRSVEDVA